MANSQLSSDNGAGLMGVNEAAKFLGKSPHALRNGYKRWGVPYMRFGGQLAFSEELLRKWIEKKMQECEK